MVVTEKSIGVFSNLKHYFLMITNEDWLIMTNICLSYDSYIEDILWLQRLKYRFVVLT